MLTDRQNPMDALPPDRIAQMKRIALKAAFLVSESFAGSYASAFKGRGMEFEEVRPYQPGDDIRTIDWNVTARAGAPFVKLFREERELTLLLVVDVSASMRFGTVERFKSETAAEVAALLATTALKSNDKIGLVVFSDHVETYIPPKKGRAHIWRVVREVLTHESRADRTDIASALDFVNRVQKRRSVCFLISDFLGEGFEKGIRQTARHHDLIAVTVHDPREEKMPDVGLIDLADLENDDRVLLDSSSADVRTRFESLWRRERAELSTLLASSGIDEIRLVTGANTVPPLLDYFRRRERRR